MKMKILIIFCLIFTSAKSFAQYDPFLGQISYVAFNFAPAGWADCNGQELSIAQYSALYSLLGTTYGGNGTSTFAVPNIQGRVMLSNGQGAGLPNYPLASTGGEEGHILTVAEMPQHTHLLKAVSSDGNVSNPSGALPANTKTLDKEYSTTPPTSGTMNASMTSIAGGNQPHPNIQPYVTFKCIIALQGIYPSRP
ncbi:Microcystin-dependent protein [Epilithonimonas lactis]|nr:Microcystin-dependent protein [Epilithonimonas lactis]